MTVDPFLSIDKYLAAPLPAFGGEISRSVHWLAIAGVQPRISENPVQVEVDKQILKKSKASETVEVERTVLETQLLTKEQVCLYYFKSLIFQRAYLDSIIRTISSSSSSKSELDKLFEVLEQDQGLASLLPFLSLFIVQQVFFCYYFIKYL